MYVKRVDQKKINEQHFPQPIISPASPKTIKGGKSSKLSCLLQLSTSQKSCKLYSVQVVYGLTTLTHTRSNIPAGKYQTAKPISTTRPYAKRKSPRSVSQSEIHKLLIQPLRDSHDRQCTCTRQCILLARSTRGRPTRTAQVMRDPGPQRLMPLGILHPYNTTLAQPTPRQLCRTPTKTKWATNNPSRYSKTPPPGGRTVKLPIPSEVGCGNDGIGSTATGIGML